MDAKKIWDESSAGFFSETNKNFGSDEPLVLSPKSSAQFKYSVRDYLHVLARYKFGVRMMQSRENIKVLDLGCNDGIGDLMIAQSCNCSKVVGVDYDHEAIEYGKRTLANDVIQFVEADFMGNVFNGGAFDAVISLDVIEHIPKEKEKIYRDTVFNNLGKHGFAVIGTPNVTMHPYASEWNKKGHINNYDQTRLYGLFAERFSNVFMFGMNDEMLNTGFYPFCCYMIALCCK